MSEKGPKNAEAVIVLGLCEVAQIEAQMFGFVQKLNRRTTVEFTTKPAISAKYGIKGWFYFRLHSTLAFPTKSKNSDGVCPACILASIAKNSSKVYL
jgi:hypothetical protein